MSVGAGNKDLALFNLRLAERKKSDEVFTQIGKGKIRKFGNFVGREQNPSSILRGGKPFSRSKISKFSVL